MGESRKHMMLAAIASMAPVNWMPPERSRPATPFVLRQKMLESRAAAAQRGVVRWPAKRGTYDPFGKLEAAWAAWAARREARNSK